MKRNLNRFFILLFLITGATGATIEDAVYDIQGRRINGIPQKNRVYIKGNRKVIINK